MATKKMGFEGKLYYGVAGATASTEITNSRDITISYGHETGETTVRGDGSSVPIETGRPVKRQIGIQWTMLLKTDDTTLSALRAAVAAGTPVALRGKDYTSGQGPDADFYITCEHGKPIGGEQTLNFSTTMPTDENRVVTPYT